MFRIFLNFQKSTFQSTGGRRLLKVNNLLDLKRDDKIKKVVMCSGKIYYDLIEAREKLKNDKVTFIRIEQLYPFPAKTLANI